MATSTSITQRYYPQLSELITVDDLPEFLHFAETGLDDLLNKIHYKNLQYSKSHRGDSAFYSMDIVTNNIGIDLPLGLRFVLNPDLEGDSTISSFPISLQYQWGVLAFLRSFNPQSFSFDPEGFFNLGLQIFKVSDAQVIAHSLNYFVNPVDTNVSVYQQLIDDINAFRPTAGIILPANQLPSVELIATLINTSPNITESIPALIFNLYIFNADIAVSQDRLQQFYNLLVPGGIEEYISSLIKPRVKATLTLSAGLEFPTEILQPVNPDGSVIADTKTIFRFAEATFFADSETGIGSELELSGSLYPQLSRIGKTPLLIGFTNAKLDLSRTTNIPEADAAGYPVDFMGLYVQHATIGFSNFGTESPGKPAPAIVADDLLIGTGGINGTISLQTGGQINRDFGLFAAELDKFSLTFKHNHITNCDISGKLTLPRFTTNGQPSVVDIQAHIGNGGDFVITALPSNNFPPIEFPGVFTFNVRSLSVGDKNGRFFMAVTGKLDFIADIPGLGRVLPKNIEIRKLVIWDNGDIEFDTGSVTLPIAFTLNAGPVNMEVSNITIGPYTRSVNNISRRYLFFGFEGMTNLGIGGVGLSGDGIKYYFTIDDDGIDRKFDSFISIDGIGIDLSIPSNDPSIIIKGHLRAHNPDTAATTSSAGTEYSGTVSVTIPKLDLNGSAGMRLTPSIPSFVVDIGLELGTPLPLGATGLGIYGFRGLIAEHYLPDKQAVDLPESASWWDYYKVKSKDTKQEGIEIDKFANKPGVALGAGISIATEFDSGTVFSSKLFVMLGLPDVFLLQGQAAILASRIGLNDHVDPPFSAFIAIDDSSFRGNLSVNYKLPSSGSLTGAIFKLQGTLDMAFFFNNASGWYLNIGKDQPESARVRASVLNLFEGYAYLMISSQGFKAGAGVSYSFNKHIGPVSVNLNASLEMGTFVSFKPIQTGGFIRATGEAYLKFFWLKLGVGIGITLAVEAPHPFNISGKFEIRLHVIFHTFNLSLPFSWHFNDDRGPLLQPQPILELPDPAKQYSPAVAVNILSNETFPLNYVTHNLGNGESIPAPGSGQWAHNFNDTGDAKQVTIPLDSFIDIELLKPVKPGTVLLGGANNQLPAGYSELIPPVKGLSNQVNHEYTLTGLDIYAWNDTGNGSWVPYHIYEAVTAIVQENTGEGAIDLSKLVQGYWQFTEPNKYNKIRLLSQHMFSYAHNSETVLTGLDAKNFVRKDIFCYESILKEIDTNWKSEALDTVYPKNSSLTLNGVTFNFVDIQGAVKTNTGYGDKSLYIESTGGSILIGLPAPVTVFTLDFGPNQHDISITPLTTVYTPGDYGQSVAQEKHLPPLYFTRNQQNQSIQYKDINQPVIGILIHITSTILPDFDGDLVIGGHLQLPSEYLSQGTPQIYHEVEANKAMQSVTLFQKAFDEQEVQSRQNGDLQDAVGHWSMDSTADTLNHNKGLIGGSPDLIPGFYSGDSSGVLKLHPIYAFTANNDALIVPFNASLKVETANFAVELTAVFDPFSAGVSTLFYKVKTDPLTGYKKGFAIHLYREAAPKGVTYTNQASVPGFDVWFTCYEGISHSGIKASGKYTVDASSSALTTMQYKQILVSVDRTNATVDIFIDKINTASVPIMQELALIDFLPKKTYLNQLSYLTQSLQKRQTDNPIEQDQLITDLEILNNNLNKTIQPVWRPNTTFAIVVKSTDVVDQNSAGAVTQSQVFGFKTAGPVGHFQQQSAVYEALEKQDRTAEFKLADLKSYVDYERSFPDALGRYELSKPVFYHNPEISLFFLKPYINAMYANWDTYNGLPAIQSSLEVQLLDLSGKVLSPQLVWTQLPDVVIDKNNYKILPLDQQILFLMGEAASEDQCNPRPLDLKRRTKQGLYQFPDLEPNKVYTAVFNAIYQPSGQTQQKNEVHRFSLKSSRFASFQSQASSFILSPTDGPGQFALYTHDVSLGTDTIINVLFPLLDDDTSNDPALVMSYAVKFDRLVFGGLQLKNLSAAENSTITLIRNINPTDANEKRLLGILITNPEPFNDPKLPAELLADTLKLTLKRTDGTIISSDQFIYVHSRDTSSVFITNKGMDLPSGDIQLSFRYKIFNGNDYQTDHDDYNSPEIAITSYL
ncbi:hypothetical protein [Mucilaginibacter aquaedulcis]|uniref:hypothetical protein n=1 Tax=Mucilaginibacter aquaedulcis TaxID=1187081 RepID=UPI0025B57535|nr:hypothetical protein [Mucilaginibacter aquaedulcis]MDN3548771.1 hypothetical protein [Mucilaginibacter aquaedulcis]